MAGKPDPLVTKKEKLSSEYGVGIGRYIQEKGFGYKNTSRFSAERDRIQMCRAYAQGNQSTEGLMQAFNATGDNPHVNLDFTPAPIAPKFVRAITEDEFGEFSYEIDAVDKLSKSEKASVKDELIANLQDKEFIQNFEETFDIKVPESEMIPEDMEDVRMAMTLDYRTSVENAAYEITKAILEFNNFPEEVRYLLTRDIVESGKACAEVDLVPGKGVIQRYVDIENFVYGETNDTTGKNAPWGAELKYHTLGDVLSMIETTNMSDNDIRDLAKKFHSRFGNDHLDIDWNSHFQKDGQPFYYDGEFDDMTIPVIKFHYKTFFWDKIATKKGPYGKRVKRKKDEYKSDNYKIEEDYYESVLSGYYIAETDYIFNYGEKKNLERPHGSMHDVELPYKLIIPSQYNHTQKSMLEHIIPNVDAIDKALLKLQQVLMNSHPEVTVIDISAWAELSMGEKEYDPLELQDIYDATGIIYKKGTDEQGQQIQDPVRTFNNAVPIDPYVATINFHMQMIREVLGFPPQREGQIQDKQLIGTMEIARDTSRNATRFISRGVQDITKRVIQSTVWLVQSIPANSKMMQQYADMVGDFDLDMLKTLEDMTMRQLGVFVHMKIDNETKLNLNRDIERSLTQKEITVEDGAKAREIAERLSPNVAYDYLSFRRRKRQKEIQQEKMQLQQQQSQLKVQEEQAKANVQKVEESVRGQYDIQEEQIRARAELQKLQMEYNLKSQLSQQEFTQKYAITQLETGNRLEADKLKEKAKDDRVLLEKRAGLEADEQKIKIKEGKQKNANPDDIGEEDEFSELVNKMTNAQD